jgi:aspartate-semialdehyde dehydrogenase
LAEPVIAVVGGETLMGREVRDQLGQGLPGTDIRLVASADDASGKLTAAGGEPAFLVKLDLAALEGTVAVVLAGSAESSKAVRELRSGARLIDLGGGLEETPSARLRAPMLEPDGFHVRPDAIHVIAHPAAIALALVMSRIHQVFPVRRSVVHVFEPASERGTAGIEELQQQTVNLLSFKPLPNKIYDAQLSYAMLAGFGEAASVALSELESRIERHLATLLSISGGAPMPSLRLIQAPVFHGHSFSLWLEFETNPGVAALEQVLNEPPVDVRGSDLEPPNNVGVAGQSGVAVGALGVDRNHPQAMWIWMAADNLHLTAENAVLVLREAI